MLRRYKTDDYFFQDESIFVSKDHKMIILELLKAHKKESEIPCNTE